MMEYKGYKAQIDFDEEDNLFYGEVINSDQGICFSGRSVDELRRAFEASVEDFIEWYRGQSGGPPIPYSGCLLIRLDPALHQSIAAQASSEGKPINTWIAERLGEVAQGPAPAALPRGR